MADIIVLAGGTSEEREVSLRSGSAVAGALKRNGHHVVVLDPMNGLESMLAELKKTDAVFPALHGAGGEDGTLQEFLQAHKILYVGSNRWASALCFDKLRYTELLEAHKIRVPNTKLVKYTDFQSSSLAKQPFVLKPNDGGSSIDTFIVRDLAKTDHQGIKHAFSRHPTMLLQELIEGTEITVAVLIADALPVIEIIPPVSGEFDYENKYNGRTQELCPPKHVDSATQTKAQALASKIHELTGCRDLSRTDMIVTGNNDLYVLETNTIPGLTEQSLVPKAAAAAGHDMATLCDTLIKTALHRDT